MSNYHTRVIHLKNKIFKQEDLFNLIKIVEKQKQNYEVRVQSNENSFTFNSIETLKQSKELENSPIVHALIKLNTTEEKVVDISLCHGNLKEPENQIIIKAKSKEEVNDIFNAFQDTLKNISEQKNTFKTLFSLLLMQTVSFVTLAALLSLFMYLVFYHPNEENVLIDKFLDKKHALLVVVYFCSLVPAFIFALALKDKIMSLWPSIEFAFGNHQLQIEKNKKYKLMFIWVVFLTPILISLYATLFLG